jgi:signal transduction histidine kinase
VARHADDVIDHARAVADAVLIRARLKADNVMPRSRTGEASAVAGERAEADRAVRGERSSADTALRGQRKQHADVLAGLLVYERAATDAYLVTERARSDDAVANRDDFLGIVAHDVRNLLNSVVLSLELLRAGDAEPEAHVSAAADRIRRYVARMNRLIGDLLDVTSIDAGKLAMTAVDADAGTLVREAVDTFQPAALEKGVCLSAAVPAAALVASFDHGRMLQVLANLIANAIKFTALGGKIDVRLEAERDALLFSVGDTGDGIDPAMLEAVFERFWQVRANDRKGHGLGLYISRCIVERHGGKIWAESRVGQGSRFYFTLPLDGQPLSNPSTNPRERRDEGALQRE